MSNTIFTEVKDWVKLAQLPKGFLSHPSGGRQSAQWSRGTSDRLESDTSAAKEKQGWRKVWEEE